MAESNPRLTRRSLLAGCLAWWTLHPLDALAIGPLNQFRLGRLRLPGDRRIRPHALSNLATEVRLQTSVNVSAEIPQVSLKSNDLFHHPLLFWIGDRRFRRFSPSAAGRLKTWLEAGGTLIIDNVGDAGPSADFDTTLRAQLKSLFPRIPLRKIPADHVLYRSFYRIDYPAGRRIDRPWFEGIEFDGRLAVIYSTNDITGAWSREPGSGHWSLDVQPGGQRQRQVALNLGINLVEYTLCQDYKDDQVHLDHLLRKRNWKIRPKTHSMNPNGLDQD